MSAKKNEVCDVVIVIDKHFCAEDSHGEKNQTYTGLEKFGAYTDKDRVALKKGKNMKFLKVFYYLRIALLTFRTVTEMFMFLLKVLDVQRMQDLKMYGEDASPFKEKTVVQVFEEIVAEKVELALMKRCADCQFRMRVERERQKGNLK